MKNKNGFTLVEILAVIMVISIILILFIAPNVWRYFNTIKGQLNELEKKELFDAAKTYATNLKENGYNIKTINTYGNNCAITDSHQDKVKASYNGLSGYDFVEYIGKQTGSTKGIVVTAGYLVENGYYNNGCVYHPDENGCPKSGGCKVAENCELYIAFNVDEIQANPSCNLDSDTDPNTHCKKYYALKDFNVSIYGDESKCILK